MRMIYVGFIICILLAPERLWAQTHNGYGLADNTQAGIIGIEADYERVIRANSPKFRLVRSFEKFPPIKGKTVSVPVNVHPRALQILARESSPPMIATLHDRRTGKPLDSCVAPCALTSPMIPPGMLTLYRYGSEPVQHGAEEFAFIDPDETVFTGFNEVDHLRARKRCAMKFKAIRATEPIRDAEPCVRLQPIMPEDAEHSGHCKVAFNVSREGETIDVRAVDCTEQIFCEPSLEGIQRWIYYPKLKYGETDVQHGKELKMSFRLTDSNGVVIPEPDGEMQPCVGSV